MAVNPHDWAVVVGIRRYADASAGWIRDLNGPDNDAEAIADWLKKDEGGGLPDDQVKVICSAEEPDPLPAVGAAPHQQRVEQALSDVAELSPTTLEGQYAGRRLYVYVSGHGIANQIDQAALITAEAKRNQPINVLITSWMGWFHEAARFKELVLWVDCCASRATGAYLKPCALMPEPNGNNAAGVRRFVAFAAGVDKEAVENQMADGLWHGAFTYALLKGLEGAAAGEVTSRTLYDYLCSNMSSFMSEDQRIPAVAQEPAFGPTDEMSFGALKQRPRFEVTLRFPPPCKGRRATIVTQASDPLTAETVLQSDTWQLQLEAGSYIAFVPESKLLHPFSITGKQESALIAIPE